MYLEDPELSGANSLLFLIRNCKAHGPGGSGAPGRRFPILTPDIGFSKVLVGFLKLDIGFVKVSLVC